MKDFYGNEIKIGSQVWYAESLWFVIGYMEGTFPDFNLLLRLQNQFNKGTDIAHIEDVCVVYDNVEEAQVG